MTDPHHQLAAFDAARTITPARRRALLLIAFGEFLDGYDLISVAGTLLILKAKFGLTPSQTGLLGASAFFGAALGLVVTGSLADRIGRRIVFVYNFWVFAALSVAAAFISDYHQLLAVRVLLGAAVGADIAVSLTFLGEISPAHSRGKWAGAVPQIAWTCGALFSLALSIVLIELLGDPAWRWIFGLGAIPAIIILIGRRSLPESPRWLLSQGRHAEAQAAMQAFGLSELSAPSALSRTAQAQVASGSGSIFDIFRAPYTRRTLLVLGILILNPLTGGGASVAAPYVMHFVGALGPIQSLAGSMVIWIGGLCGSIIALLTLDKIGRIWSTTLSAWGTSICLLSLIVFHDRPAIFVAIYAFYGVVIWYGTSANWLLPTELLPTHLRARSQGIANGCSRFMVGLAAWIVPTSIAAFGFTATFVGLSVVGIFVGLYALTGLKFEAARRALDETDPGGMAAQPILEPG